jgi:hypothetical protein
MIKQYATTLLNLAITRTQSNNENKLETYLKDILDEL